MEPEQAVGVQDAAIVDASELTPVTSAQQPPNHGLTTSLIVDRISAVMAGIPLTAGED